MFKLNPVVAAVSLAMLYPMASFAADTGDAPASYGLATHDVVAGAPHIGDVVPDDNAPINSLQADGDDNGATPDDEDGVFAFPVLVQDAKEYDVNVFVYNPSSQPATLTGWVDFDGNGTFEADEASTATVPAGASNLKVKLLWPNTFGISTDYFGTTYARFRISSSAIAPSEALGGKPDGEVEDYTLTILEDSDGDEIPNSQDLDNDNDGIPDAVEGTTLDQDNDGTPNYLDVDSDDDSIPDFIEAGINPAAPADSDGDGQPDYLDLDSDNDGTPDIADNAGDADGDGISDAIEGNIDSDGDGIVNSLDIDSDNDVIPDAIELGLTAPTPVDTDGDLVPDYLDLDSDNDGIPDIHESNSGEISIEALDANNDGAADSGLQFGSNGFVNDIETATDNGIPIYAMPDTDGDGVRDFRDLDADGDGTNDVIESGGTDTDNNGIVDVIVDANGNGVPDNYDFTQTGGVDTDGDQVDDVADVDFVSGPDADNDGVLDTFDLDVNGDGIVDGVVSNQLNDLFRNGILPDDDGDFRPDFRDDDSIGTQGGGTGGSTAGTTDSGTTDTGTTAGGTTAGGTTAGSAPTTTGGTSNGQGIVETGLSGSACSIGTRAGTDPLFPGIVMLSGLVLMFRRKWQAKTKD